MSERGFAYGEDDRLRQVIHVVEPATHSEPRPAVVLFHGGGPTGGTPLQDMDWAEPLAEQGYVTFMAGYRLFDEATGENPWPTQLEDARRAVRWVRAHAAELGVDPARVCAMGHSSGGHLASLLGVTDSPTDSDVRPTGISSRVDCVVTMSGDTDLLVPYPDAGLRRTVGAWLGGTVEELPQVWRQASPAHQVDDQTVPFLVVHGTHDEGVPVEMARNLVAALSEAAVEHTYAELPAGHMDICALDEPRALWDAFLAHHLHPKR